MSFNHSSTALFAGVIVYAAIGTSAWAQTNQPPATYPRVIPAPVPPGSPRPNPTIPEKRSPSLSSESTSNSNTTLSDQLHKSDGVIRPPANTDNGLVQTPPASGATMPVIPPPGAPGGRQDVTPK